MNIHTVAKGEDLTKIAKQYGIAEPVLASYNYLASNNDVIEGQELLILTPTRTYTAKAGDSISGISLRFSIKESELLSNNPGISNNLAEGSILSLKYTDSTYGIAATNGYFYNGCTMEKLTAVLPYLTYVTVASAIRDNNGLTMLFDDTEIVKCARQHSKIPILRVYDNTISALTQDSFNADNLCDSIIALAKGRGYSGISYAAFGYSNSDTENLLEFIVNFRKKLIGQDMLLFWEIDESSPTKISDYADGAVMSYDKISLGKIPSFSKGELAAFSRLSSDAESSKIFIDLPSLALCGSKYIGYMEAIRLAHSKGVTINTDPTAMVCYYEYKDDNGKSVKVILPSLKNAEAKLDLVSELGFLGISFDIMRVPISYLAMFNAIFKTAPYSYL
jgi:spore germination protein YaaH